MKELNISQLSLKFENNFELSIDSLRIEEGDFLAILGSSGCGKSTLLSCIAGLQNPDAGSISFGDQVFLKNGKSMPVRKRKISMVFQDFGLIPHYSVFKNISIGNKLKTKQIEAILLKLNLFKKRDQLPDELSGGERQRTALGRALAADRSLLLMDEPLSSIDPTQRMELRKFINQIYQDTQCTCVLVSHDPDDVMTLANKVAIMEAGEITWMGTKEAFLRARCKHTAQWNPRVNMAVGSVWNHLFDLDLDPNALFALPYDAFSSEPSEKPPSSLLSGWEMDYLSYNTPFGAFQVVQRRIGLAPFARKPQKNLIYPVQ